jgi:hypothetical protein
MRQVYRIDLTGSYHLRGVLRCPAFPEVEGKLTDISSTGAGLVFLANRDPKLTLGDELELIFCAPTGGEVETLAIVRSFVDRGDFVRYGFEFADPEELDARVPLLLRAMFNRRRAPRVTPEESVEVELTHESGAVSGSLVEVSTVGAAFEIPFSCVEAFERGAVIQCEFSLPTCARALSLAAVVRSFRLVGPVVHLGVEFDVERTEEFDDVFSELQDFIASREIMSPFVS